MCQFSSVCNYKFNVMITPRRDDSSAIKQEVINLFKIHYA